MVQGRNFRGSYYIAWLPSNLDQIEWSLKKATYILGRFLSGLHRRLPLLWYRSIRGIHDRCYSLLEFEKWSSWQDCGLDRCLLWVTHLPGFWRFSSDNLPDPWLPGILRALCRLNQVSWNTGGRSRLRRREGTRRFREAAGNWLLGKWLAAACAVCASLGYPHSRQRQMPCLGGLYLHSSIDRSQSAGQPISWRCKESMSLDSTRTRLQFRSTADNCTCQRQQSYRLLA